MGNGNFKAEVVLKNQKVKFEGVSEFNPTRPVDFDYMQPVGDDDGFRGLELLLLNLGGCVSTTMVFLLRRKNRKIDAFKMNLEGVNGETRPSIEKIIYEAEIVSEDITDEDMQELIREVEVYSPVWNMIKGNTVLEGSYRLIRKEGL